MRSDEVRSAAAACTGLLGGALERDWSARAGTLDMTVAQVVAHVAQVLHFYAADLAGGPAEIDALELRVHADRPPATLVAAVRAAAFLLAATIEASDDDARGFHPSGAADPSGFAAMACDELLVHTDDAARGLGLAFEPDAHLAAHVVRRLFPWAPHGGRSWPTLRWANGRAALGERPRLANWRWHCAPLDEWDGSGP
ncbi:maleylpyruvate isomerase N-terminal domain-containing protein [Pseudonocardia yuanmonensis]|uniref:maleylpyruvate isomerase N-terminal domain-containing protein n=1 Tax=Pseudonocardia yuanmonensis TaxID=1095914 RepID=UPI0031EC92BD